MPTVQEILRQTGFSDYEIERLDTRAVSAFTGILSAAEQERQAAQQAQEAAEIAQRSNAEFYDQTIAPALNNWGTEKANLEAQAAYYRTQNEAARAAGFVPEEAPGFQPRDSQGRYVSGAPGGVPGSPTFQGVDDLRRDVGNALGVLTDLQWRHQRLFNEPMPISPTELVRQAESQRLDPVAYAERRFGYQAREQELARKSQEDHDNKIRQEAEAARDRHWSEKIGSNPDVRISQTSRFADVTRAVTTGDRPDPLKLNEAQRRQATTQAIRQEISERTAEVA